MTRKRNTPLWVIDAAGALCVLMGGAGALWLLLVQTQDTTAALRSVQTLIASAEADLRMAEATSKRQRAARIGLQSSLDSVGRLPEETPIEDYFRELSRLAARHRVRIILQSPLSPRRYPGLLEERFAYEVTAATADLVAFLAAIERTNFWADVSYLVLRNDSSPDGDRRMSIGSLTFSLFSATSEDSTDGQESS